MTFFSSYQLFNSFFFDYSSLLVSFFLSFFVHFFMYPFNSLTCVHTFSLLVYYSRTQDTISVMVLQEPKYGNKDIVIIIIIISCIDLYRVNRFTIEPDYYSLWYSELASYLIHNSKFRKSEVMIFFRLILALLFIQLFIILFVYPIFCYL